MWVWVSVMDVLIVELYISLVDVIGLMCMCGVYKLLCLVYVLLLLEEVVVWEWDGVLVVVVVLL